MNIDEALKQIEKDKAMYFRYKHNLFYYERSEPMTEEHFLRQVERKTLSPFKKWERSKEYRNLCALLMDSQFDKDLQQVFENVRKKALSEEATEQQVKLFLQLGKEVKGYSKLAQTQFDSVEGDQEEDDLII